MAKPTPGPWGYDEIDRVVVKDSVVDIAYMDRAASNADARLIAAAPDLLEALHQISIASQNSMSTKEECGRIARAAIKKATGEE